VDLNGDGHNDVISGSYWPGHIFIFEGRGDGKFQKGHELCDEQGQKLHAGRPWKSDRKPDMDSLASAPHAIDYDCDGDLDLLVGNIAGRVILICNEGTAKEPKFSQERQALKADGRTIKVLGGDTGPTTVDWDGDGLWDLIVGAGDGSVRFYRNTGTDKQPEFAAAQKLLRKSSQGYRKLNHDEEPTWHGLRVKVCAVDYNCDGLLDLLVGDLARVKQPEPELTEEQKAERKRLRKEYNECRRELSELNRKYRDDPKKRNAETKELRGRSAELYAKLRPLQARNKPTGWVWLYLQKPTQEASATDSGKKSGSGSGSVRR
jgi:hypothetical protein